MKKLLALVVSIVAIGACAAPAAAERPDVVVNVECDIQGPGGIGHQGLSVTGQAGVAQLEAITAFDEQLASSGLTCIPGTRQMSVEPA